MSSQVKFGAAWADKKVFLTQMSPLCLNNHTVPMLEVQILRQWGTGTVVQWRARSVLWALPSSQAGQGGRTTLLPA